MVWVSTEVYGVLFCFVGFSTAMSTCQSDVKQQGDKTVEFCSNTTETSTRAMALDGFSASGTPGQCTCKIEVDQHYLDKEYYVVLSNLCVSCQKDSERGTSLSFHTSFGVFNLPCGKSSTFNVQGNDTPSVQLSKTQVPLIADYCVRIELAPWGRFKLSCLPPLPSVQPLVTTATTSECYQASTNSDAHNGVAVLVTLAALQLNIIAVLVLNIVNYFALHF